MTREDTCCFTGHRKIPAIFLKYVKVYLRRTVEVLIKEGYCNFVTGGALGMDTFAALTVLKLKEKYPYITLTVVAPFLGQADSFAPDDRRLYYDIKNQCDNYEALRINYSKNCMQERNRRMVDMSSVCVAYLKDSRSGTGMTVSYAKKNNLKVINIRDEEAENKIIEALNS